MPLSKCLVLFDIVEESVHPETATTTIKIDKITKNMIPDLFI
jgi:hypothetical protein